MRGCLEFGAECRLLNPLDKNLICLFDIKTTDCWLNLSTLDVLGEFCQVANSASKTIDAREVADKYVKINNSLSNADLSHLKLVAFTCRFLKQSGVLGFLLEKGWAVQPELKL